MKNVKSLLWMLAILPAFFLSSCDTLPEVEQEGTLELGIYTDEIDGQLKSALEDSVDIRTHFVVVSVVNEAGELILDDEQLELYKFGGHWVTRQIKLKEGVYDVTKFFIVDPNGNVLFAAPIEGSPKAYLVNNPLPLPFEIIKDQKTRVVPEVLRVIDDPPEDFGYVTFSYSVVKVLNFFIAVYIDDPRIMAPTRWTDAKLTVVGHNCIDYLADSNSMNLMWEDPDVFPCERWKHIFKLEPRINKITVRNYMGYLLIIEKEGFKPVRMRVLREELIKTSPDNPLLIGLPVNNHHVLVLQPGPEEGKDAMISRSVPEDNFGKYPFFEAIAMPPETSFTKHHNSRSLIQFDLNQLPKSATIKRAVLTLYYPEHIYLDSVRPANNATGVTADLDSLTPWPVEPLAVLQKVISPWEEHEVTWKAQPKTTEEDQVFIPRIYYITDVACDCFVPPVSETIDVTELLMPDEAGNRAYGMMLKLFNEENPEWLRFASSDFKSVTTGDYEIKRQIWPKLEIYYTLPTW